MKAITVDGKTILSSWEKASSIPGGKLIYNLLIKKLIPYTGSLGAEIIHLEAGKTEIRLKDRRGVRNHLNSIHAMALANLGEFSTGVALISALPPGMRGILKGFQIEYLKKARGELKAICEYTQPVQEKKQDIEVLGEIFNSEGEVVTRVKALWRVDVERKS